MIIKVLLSTFYIFIHVISSVKTEDISFNLGNFSSECFGTIVRDITILDKEYEDYPVSFSLLCSLILGDYSHLTSGINASIYKILNSKVNNCNISDTKELTQKHDIYIISKLISSGNNTGPDNLRSRALACNTYLNSVSEGKFSDIEIMATRNAIDLALGYVRIEHVHWMKMLDNIDYGTLVYKFLSTFPQIEPKEFSIEFFNNERLMSELSLLSDKDRNTRNLEINYSRYIEDKIESISKRINAMFCVDTLKFHDLVNEISIMYLSLMIFRNKISTIDYFNFKFNHLYTPEHEDYKNILLWLAFKIDDLRAPFEDLTYGFEEHRLLNPELDDYYYEIVIQDVLGLMTKLRGKFIKFYRNYIELHQGLGSLFRNHEDINEYIRKFLNTTLCNLDSYIIS